jgi:hypothetical protein
MNHTTNAAAELDQTDQDILYEVSDEALRKRRATTSAAKQW